MHPIFAWLPHGNDWIWIPVLWAGALILWGGLLAAMILWIAALVSCIKNESPDNKVVWVLVILFTHLIGGLLYFLVRRPQRLRELGH